MKRDVSYRASIATKLNVFDYVDKKTFNKKNKEKSWEYSKYKNLDPNFICISKDGTIGDVYRVGGLIIALPSQDGKEIINIDEIGDHSFWKRTPIPDDFLKLEENYAKDISEANQYKRKDIRDKYTLDRKILIKKHLKFINKEFDKREDGFFIKIDEEVFYITGSFYMFLNYYYLTDSDMYPLFRTTAAHTWWHWEAVKAESDSFGELRFKSRRVAWTSEAASEALNYATITKYGNIPVVSERKDLAIELFETKIIDPFKYYPTYFKPILNDPNYLDKSKLELIHNSPKKENSRIKLYPTKLTAYDSTRVKPYAINDEVFKMEDVDFTKFRARHKHCYNKTKSLHPKGKFGSTIGDKKINVETASYEWEQADPLKRDSSGRTGTGLIALFVDTCFTNAEDGMFDKWGYPIVYDPVEPIYNEIDNIIEFGAVTRWEEEEKKLKNKEDGKSDLTSFYRNSPRTIEHALRTEGGIKNDFDIDNLNAHIDYLNTLDAFDYADNIKRGNLEWIGEKFTSDVRWIPNTKGKIQTTWIPEKELQNVSIKRMIGGKTLDCPANNHIGCFGVDPYNIAQAAGNVQSDGAVVGYTKYNMTGAPTNSFFLVYKERPDKRDDFFEDVCKIAKFFGMYALVESNKERLLEFMYDNGFRGYSMNRPDKKWKDFSPMEKKWGGIPASKEVANDSASALKDYIMDYVGQNVETDCKVYFKELIKEWIRFDVNKRKEFDLGVASGLAKIGSQYNPKQRKTIDLTNKSGVTIASFSA